ncbi:MAG: hypothetical protein NVSMB42_20380 [Herpetosiphon sp.]
MSRLHVPSLPVRLPALPRLFSSSNLLNVGLFLAVVLPLVLFAAGVGVRKGKGTPVVVNQVFVDADPRHEWIELLNTTTSGIDVEGWTVASRHGGVARLHGQLEPGVLTVVHPEVGGWQPTSDRVVLRTASDTLVDGVGWGDVGAQAGIPLVKLPFGAGKALIRNPQGLDSGTADDWWVTRPSPAVQSPASLGIGLHRMLFAATNYIAVIGGLLLWGAFLLIGLIARRFETLTGQRAYWPAMVVAPVGIVIYNAIQAYAFFTAGRMTDCRQGLWLSACQQGYAFTALLLSSAAMAVVVYRFYHIARQILDLREA